MRADGAIEGVILAAGASTRAGAFKPALLLGGRPMLAHCVAALGAVCARIIVVAGHESERLRALVEGMDGVECVVNSAYRKGMFTSVKAGLSRVEAERCFVLPVDIPLVPPAVFATLLSVEAGIVVPSYRGRNGHPVCCSAAVIPRILRAEDSSSFRAVCRAIGVRVVPVEAEEILLDVDTPEDYAGLQERFARGRPASGD